MAGIARSERPAWRETRDMNGPSREKPVTPGRSRQGIARMSGLGGEGAICAVGPARNLPNERFASLAADLAAGIARYERYGPSAAAHYAEYAPYLAWIGQNARSAG